MAEPRRVDPQKAREMVQSSEALLVCAYDNEEECRSMRLEGADTLGELQTKESRLSKDDKLIFYCA